MKDTFNFSFKQLNTKLALFLLISSGLFFSSQILIMAQVGTKSEEIEIIRLEIDQIRKENEIINSKIDKEKSLTEINATIKEQGLVEKQVIQIPKHNASVALN